MFKKVSLSALSIIISFVWIIQTTMPASASGLDFRSAGWTQTVSTLQAEDPEATLTLERLGKTDLVLQGPYDSTSVVFSVPTSWQLSAGAQLDLKMNASFTGQVDSAGNSSYVFGGSVWVIFNGVTQAILNIDQLGEQTKSIPIQDRSLRSQRKDGRHELVIRVESGLDCQVDQNFNLVVSAISSITLPHKLVTPDLNLSRFPSPISIDAAWPDKVIIVIPDQPTEEELQSALTISAGLGNLVSKALVISLVKESMLTEEEKSTSHLILVGKASSLGSLSSYSLASPVSDSGYKASANEDDGVIQMLASPWNNSKMVLLASGGSDAGVVKAAQAISTGVIRTTGSPNVAVVTAVSERQFPEIIPVDQSLESLGYTRTMTDRLNYPGEAYEIIEFIVPPGQVAAGDTYFNLVYSHSALLNFARSGLIVKLNGQPIGSSQFTAETANKKNTISFSIPGVDLLSGRNQLEVRAQLYPFDTCSRPQFEGLWFSVWRESSLHLPLEPHTTGSTSVFDLDFYPAPFVLHPTLGDTAFVVAREDIAGWNAAANIAARLGDQLNGEIITAKAFFSDSLTDDARQNYHLLIVGNPDQNSLYSELQDVMPSPIDPATNTPKQVGYVTYQLSDQSSVGYLELFRSPWNNNQVILAVFGNNTEGLGKAVDALSISDLRTQLVGNYAEVTDNQLITVDTRILSEQMVERAAPAQGVTSPVTTSQDVSSPATSQGVLTAGQTDSPVGIEGYAAVDARPISLDPYPVQRPAWLFPVLLGTVVLLLLALSLVVINGFRQKRQ